MRFRDLVAAASFLFLPLTACAADAGYVEGADYRTITPAMSVDVPKGKVQVMELFSYGCPHCFDMDAPLAAWLKGRPEVELVRVPAAFSRVQPDGSPNTWYTQAKAFYTAQALGVGEKLHPVLFEAIHVQHRPLRTEEDLAKVFAEQGVPAKEFKAAFNSFSVDAKVAQAMELTKRSGITGVPALIINGKYHVVGKRATSHQDFFKIADYLIAKERGAH